MNKFYVAVLSTLALAGCSASNSLSPQQLIGDSQSNLAVREFMVASRALAYAYGFEFGFAEDALSPGSPRSRVNRDLFNFPIRAEIPYSVSLTTLKEYQLPPHPVSEEFRSNARANYIKAGAYASMIVCRNYLSGLRDRNEYFEFLQKELGILGGLTNIALELADANGTTRTAVTAGLQALNGGIDAYESFRFLSPEIETIIPLVQEAQVALRDHYLTVGNRPTTFSGAMNVVSQIEYQCTRSGVRSLINKTLIQGRPQFVVQNGILYSKAVTPPAQPKGVVAETTK